MEFLQGLSGPAGSKVIERGKVIRQRVLRGRLLKGVQPLTSLCGWSVPSEERLECHLRILRILLHRFLEQGRIVGAAKGGQQTCGVTLMHLEVRLDLRPSKFGCFVCHPDGHAAFCWGLNRGRRGRSPRPNRWRGPARDLDVGLVQPGGGTCVINAQLCSLLR